MMRPLHDRVLIKPYKNPDQTESGLHLPEHWTPDQQGTVVAVGRPAHPRRAEAGALADRLEAISIRLAEGDNDRIIEVEERKAMAAAATLLRDLVRREPCVRVGDDVIFSWTSGQEITLDDDRDDGRLLILREEDLLAVLESEAM